jgi:hypothetical protein
MAQQKIYEVSVIDFEVVRMKDAIGVKAKGIAPGGNFQNPQLTPWFYIIPPRDGIYDYDFVAEEAGPGTDVLTDIEVSQVIPMPESFRGIRIHASNNSKMLRRLVRTAMIPNGTDPMNVGEARIEKDKLIVPISYGGGHQVHEFEAYWDGSYPKSNPPQAEIILHHNAHNDHAMALFHQELEFDLLGLGACVIQLYNGRARVQSLEYNPHRKISSSGGGSDHPREELKTSLSTTAGVFPSVERGYSNSYDIGEAIRDAMSKLPGNGGVVVDHLAKYTVVNIGAEVGGIAGLNRLYVDVTG